MIYFDYASTTPIHPEVMMAYKKLLDQGFYNQDALYQPAIELNRLYNQSKQQLLHLLNLTHYDVIYTSGATEANNLAIKGLLFKYLNQNKHIITTTIEHPSVLEVFKQMERFGFEVTYLAVNKFGKIDLEVLKQSIKANTILVSMMAVNNETGIILPIKEVGLILKKIPTVLFHVDAVQAFGKLTLDYELIDMMSVSQHKIHGLKGSGALIKKKGIVLEPLIIGGQQEQGLRGGTADAVKHLLFPKALRLMQATTQDEVQMLHTYLKDKLQTIPDVVVHQFHHQSPYIVSLSCLGFRSQVIIQALSNMGIYCSAKSTCSSKKQESHVLNALFDDDMTRQGTIRISIDTQTTKKEIDELVKALSLVLLQIKKEASR